MPEIYLPLPKQLEECASSVGKHAPQGVFEHWVAIPAYRQLVQLSAGFYKVQII
jgi:hypothetical protein